MLSATLPAAKHVLLQREDALPARQASAVERTRPTGGLLARSIWRWLCPSYSEMEKCQLLETALGHRGDELPLTQRGSGL